MQQRLRNAIGEESLRFFTREQIDKILQEGARRGSRGSHTAIERILKHEPGLERAELWKRIRRLKQIPRAPAIRRCVWDAEDDELLRKGYESGASEKRKVIRELLKRHPEWPSSTIWKRAAKLRLVHKRARRGEERRLLRWSEDDDGKLLSLAGEKKPGVIAKILHRSEHAVCCRLAWLGKRTRVHHDGYSRRALAEDLHMGRQTIQRFIAEGFLEVRDPRITRQSIARLTKSGVVPNIQPDSINQISVMGQSPDPTTLREHVQSASPALDAGRTAPRNGSRAKRVWAGVAKTLNVDLRAVERWVAQGALKLYDPRITEQSFRRFCRHYGALISDEFLNRETRSWLRSSMDWDRGAGKEIAEMLVAPREHALVVRRCSRCGRDIRGNVFFRHRKECRGKNPKEGNGMPRVEEVT
jgi:hypothetical protein